MRGPGKYGNKTCVYKGMKFDSIREFNRYRELELLQMAGEINSLERQVKFELVPKQDGERSLSYIADFCYKEKGEYVVEDSKGHKTEGYKIKRKLMLYFHGIKIRET